MRYRMLLTIVVVSLMSTACVSAKSYVDPQLPRVGYADLLRRTEPRPVQVSVEFQRNGTPHAGATSIALDRVVRVLEASKIFSTVGLKDEPGRDQIQVVLNNVGDIGDAVSKGIGTGLTFGAAGSMVTDGYVFTATYRPVGKAAIQKTYRHALHTTIGNASGPAGLTPMSTQEAFDKVVQDLVLNFLLDLQKEERL